MTCHSPLILSFTYYNYFKWKLMLMLMLMTSLLRTTGEGWVRSGRGRGRGGGVRVQWFDDIPNQKRAGRPPRICPFFCSLLTLSPGPNPPSCAHAPPLRRVQSIPLLACLRRKRCVVATGP